MIVARPNGGAYQRRHSISKDPNCKKFIEFIGLGDTEDELIAGQDRMTRAKFSKYNRRIAKIEEDAERIEHNIIPKLEPKRRHDTIKEAHPTAILSATVFRLTVTFKEGKYGNDDVFTSGYIGKRVVTTEFVSIAITLTSMWAARPFANFHIWGKKGLCESIRRKAGELRTREKGRRQEANDMQGKHSSRSSNYRPHLEQGIGTAKSRTPTNAS
ncbi:hypothetical protein F5Y19DRAFT_493592 [Xylariaceae sp. FL1651]|nr:hypothetical protein F5Y19DRAFT_493592 [Xylariaceae sp. FL1651]